MCCCGKAWWLAEKARKYDRLLCVTGPAAEEAQVVRRICCAATAEFDSWEERVGGALGCLDEGLLVRVPRSGSGCYMYHG